MTFGARVFAAALTLVATASSAMAADDYPSKPIRLILGFAAGGAPDLLARTVGEHLGQAWNQTVVVENRTGAAGNIAMAAVAKAEPDGYTLALAPVGNAAVNPSLMPDLPYKLDQFAPVTLIANVENVLVVGADSPIKSAKDLIALGKKPDANLTYATPGAGSIAHLAAELFALNAGIQMRQIGYRGVMPGLTDVMRGEVTAMFAQVSTAKPLIDSGKLRALGVASKARNAALPDVPTIAEAAGMPGFEAVSWYALMAPAGTPQPVIAKLRDGVVQAIGAPAAKATLQTLGAQPVGGTPAELADLIAADTARWGKVIRDANIKPAQ
jgi:tripartite-type tricarboxylate transporter receptor subunit TctC